MCSWAAISANMSSRLPPVSVLESAKDLQGTRQGVQDQMAKVQQHSVLPHTHMPASCAVSARGATAAPYTMGPNTGPRPASSATRNLVTAVKWLADHCRGQLTHQCP